jgi:hypothetical protein
MSGERRKNPTKKKKLSFIQSSPLKFNNSNLLTYRLIEQHKVRQCERREAHTHKKKTTRRFIFSYMWGEPDDDDDDDDD